MLIIPIKDGENIDRALKRYKRKFDKTGTVRQLRARQAFIKPSVTNRMKIQKAAYIQNMKRVFSNTLESSGRMEAAFELFSQRDMVESGYRVGRIARRDYEDLMLTFDLIEEELDLRMPAPHPTVQ